jgi:hypothetical protein
MSNKVHKKTTTVRTVAAPGFAMFLLHSSTILRSWTVQYVNGCSWRILKCGGLFDLFGYCTTSTCTILVLLSLVHNTVYSSTYSNVLEEYYLYLL